MSNWINEAAQEFQDTKSEEELLLKEIHDTNFWFNLKEQVKNDVEKINSHSAWSEVIEKGRIEFIDHSESFLVVKGSKPSITVKVSQDKDKVKVTFSNYEHDPHFAGYGDYSYNITVEDGKAKVSQYDSKSKFIEIPEEFSQKILMYIVGRIKESKK